MRHTRLLCAIGVSLWSAVVAGSQAVAPAALSGALRDQVKNGRFGIVTSIRGLPLGVRDGLQTLFGSQTLDIAEPGAGFQVPDVIVNSKLPIRRLVAAGCTNDYCLVYYERGGGAHTWHVVLFRWTPAATRFEWGGAAPGGLATIDDVRNAILSGVIKGPARFWLLFSGWPGSWRTEAIGHGETAQVPQDSKYLERGRCAEPPRLKPSVEA